MTAKEQRLLKQIEDDLDQANSTEDFREYGELVEHTSVQLFLLRTGRLEAIERFDFSDYD